MHNRQRNLLLYIGMILIAIMIGGDVVAYMFTGLITLLGFVMLVEGIPWLKWICVKLNTLIDIAFFVFGVYAKIHFGVTIAMALLFAGLGYSMLYRPYLIRNDELDKEERK